MRSIKETSVNFFLGPVHIGNGGRHPDPEEVARRGERGREGGDRRPHGVAHVRLRVAARGRRRDLQVRTASNLGGPTGFDPSLFLIQIRSWTPTLGTGALIFLSKYFHIFGLMPLQSSPYVRLTCDLNSRK